MVHRAYDRVVVGAYSDGSRMVVNLRTWAMLDVARDRLGYDEPLTILQGSYHRSTVSAGTHSGGGAVDLTPFDADRKVHALRAIGFAAWHRLPIPDVWGEHIHAVAIGDREMSPEARAQIRDYYAHRNGLADHARDPTWHPHPIPIFDFRRWRREETLLQSDKQWLDRRFDALHEQLSAFRESSRDRDQRSAERDRRVLSRLRQVADELTDTATRAQVRRAREDIAEILEILQSGSGAADAEAPR
jgi:hypothetical protein